MAGRKNTLEKGVLCCCSRTCGGLHIPSINFCSFLNGWFGNVIMLSSTRVLKWPRMRLIEFLLHACFISWIRWKIAMRWVMSFKIIFYVSLRSYCWCWWAMANRCITWRQTSHFRYGQSIGWKLCAVISLDNPLFFLLFNATDIYFTIDWHRALRWRSVWWGKGPFRFESSWSPPEFSYLAAFKDDPFSIASMLWRCLL